MTVATNDIIINSTSRCSRCKQLKEWCDTEGIAYVEVDLENDLEKLQSFKTAGTAELPIVEKNGRVHSGIKGAKEFILETSGCKSLGFK